MCSCALRPLSAKSLVSWLFVICSNFICKLVYSHWVLSQWTHCLQVSWFFLTAYLITEVEKFILANTQELSKDKWLCPLSGKKFKGPDFVRKHLLTKHMEKIDEVKKEVSTTIYAAVKELAVCNIIWYSWWSYLSQWRSSDLYQLIRPGDSVGRQKFIKIVAFKVVQISCLL